MSNVTDVIYSASSVVSFLEAVITSRPSVDNDKKCAHKYTFWNIPIGRTGSVNAVGLIPRMVNIDTLDVMESN